MLKKKGRIMQSKDYVKLHSSLSLKIALLDTSVILNDKEM